VAALGARRLQNALIRSSLAALPRRRGGTIATSRSIPWIQKPVDAKKRESEQDLVAATPHYHGHRERFREAGPDALSDYELLEAVLFRAQPRRDVKPLAKTLIATFGSFAEVIAAPAARLAEVKGLGEAACRYCLQSALRRRWGDHLQARVRARLRGHRVEAPGFVLPLWPLGLLDQGQESGGAGGQTRGRRGLER
jgi:hypothetical protein